MLKALCYRCPLGVRRVLPVFRTSLTRDFPLKRHSIALLPTKLMRRRAIGSGVTGSKNSVEDEDAGRLSEQQYQREMLLAKAFYTTSSMSGVFLFPYLNLYLVDLGASAALLGLLCTVRPWLGSLSMLVGPLIADSFKCHKFMLVLCLGVSTVLRSMMWASGELGQVVVLLILAEFIAAPVGPFIDSHVQHTAKEESDYGKQRLWASAGWGITAPIAGAMVQRFGLGIGFLCYTALSIPSLIAATLLRAAPPTSLHTQDHQQHQHRMGAQGAELNGPAAPGGASLSSPPHMRDNQQYHQGAKFGCPNALDTDRRASTWERMRQLGGSIPVWQLLLQCTASGIGGGMIGTYLFLFARDIGALPSLLGLLLMANCAAEVPMFYFQEHIMKIMSPQSMLNVALGATVLRLALYAAAGQVANPWIILPIELLQGFTMAIAWSGACVSSKRLAPKGLEATMQGVVTATMAGFGGGFGGLLGGVLRDRQFGWSTIWGISAGVVTGIWLMSVALPQFAPVLRTFTKVQKRHAG